MRCVRRPSMYGPQGLGARRPSRPPAGSSPGSRLTVRPTARPEPFSVWTNSGLALGSRRKRMFARRAWKSPQLRAGRDLHVAVPRSASRPRGRRSSRLAKPMSPVHSSDDAVRQPEPLQDLLGAPPSCIRARRRSSRASEKIIISTLLNWCWRMSPRMSLP